MITRRQFNVGLGIAGLGLAVRRAAGEPAANPIIPVPKVNQVGYRPQDEKGFAWTSAPGESPEEFQVVNAAGNTVFRGKLNGRLFDERAAAGEWVRRGDFAALREQGTYRVRVGRAMSAPFTIGARVYDSLLVAAARCFWLIRANVAIDDPITGIAHGPSHLSEHHLLDPWGKGRDVSGGWYNAGDFGKWVHMEAISASAMMWLYELRPEPVRELKLEIDTGSQDLPDLLWLARWGLEFLLRMQNPDGSVLHKVDSQPNFWLGPIEKDPYPRHIMRGGSIDAGVFVGAMLQAGRVYRSFDAEFASRCESAAGAAWTWLEANPNVLQHDPYYVDDQCWEEELWALCEMTRSRPDARLYERVMKEMEARTLAPLTWKQPQIFGYYSLCAGDGVRADVKARAREKVLSLARSLQSIADGDGYGVALKPSEYVWGSVENVLYIASALFFAAEISGDRSLRDTAHRQLDYVLGENSLDHSFVARFGAHPSIGAHHWTNWSLGKIMPGWVSGGPNQFANGADPLLRDVIARGTPPAKCFVDVPPPHTSWASNEGTTSENAGLVFAAGMAAFS